MRRTTAEWERLAGEVIVDMLETQLAVTISEMEARASDETWNPHIVSSRIDPHHLTTARQRLLSAGTLLPEVAPTRGSDRLFTTWSLGTSPAKSTAAAAARKRLLTARHDGWARRGGAGRGLIGAGGELAFLTALVAAGCYAPIFTSTTNVLGVDLSSLGEVDFVCGLYDASDAENPVAVTVMTEVKNTRHWFYAKDATGDDGDIRRFLKKAAHVQAARPAAMVCPVVLVRKAHSTLVALGAEHGFAVASSDAQVVLADHDIIAAPHHFAEVRDELGYTDLRLLTQPSDRPTTSYHLGIARKYIPRVARATASTWQVGHLEYAP